MSPKLKPIENVLIDVSTLYNPNSLATDEKCYFLHHDKSQTAGNVRHILLQNVFHMISILIGNQLC